MRASLPTDASTPASPRAGRDFIEIPLMDATLDKRGLVVGLIFSVLLTGAVYVGSQGLRGFDGALAGYCFATVFALFGVVYRYAVWLQRPATKLYWKRGWQLFWAPGQRLRNTLLFFKMGHEKLLEQRFLRKRSMRRWIAHQLIFWGCVLAILVTFPLTFGWVRFESLLADPHQYVAVLFGYRLEFLPFAARSFVGWTIFHLLDIAAVLCIAGVAVSLVRRVKDEAELAVQRFDNDFIPLFLLFAVSVTGLMLTVSNMYMEGKFYYWITTTHAATVMLWLMFLPFGKFFHIFQRIANVGVWFYKAAGAEAEQAKCADCGDEYTSLMHQRDLQGILPTLDFDYTAQGDGNWQNLCPSCRRKHVVGSQFQAVGKKFL